MVRIVKEIWNRGDLRKMQAFSQEWEEIHKKQQWGTYPSEQVIRFVARNFYKKEREKVKFLDFGCGAGANTWYLAREGFDVYAFDGSESAINRARIFLKSEGYEDVKFSVRDGVNLDYPENFFDCVIDSVCIYANKLSCIRTMYKEIYDILREGGKLFSSCFGTKTEGFGTGEKVEDGTYKNISCGVLKGRAEAHFFTMEELRKTVEEAGFQNIVIDQMLYTDNGVRVEQFYLNAEK